MNPVPFLALAVVASGYAVAIEDIDLRYADDAKATLTAYAAVNDTPPLAHDFLSHGSQALDDPHCAGRDMISETLAHDFAERAVETRIAGDGLDIELWASDLMGTWTVVHHGHDGISCIIASGTGWTNESTAANAFDQVALSG